MRLEFVFQRSLARMTVVAEDLRTGLALARLRVRQLALLLDAGEDDLILLLSPLLVPPIQTSAMLQPARGATHGQDPGRR